MIDPQTALPIGEVRRLQIITAALLVGVLGFAAVSILQHSRLKAPVAAAIPLAITAGAVFAMSFLMSILIPAVIEAAQFRRIVQVIKSGNRLSSEQLALNILRMKFASHVVALAMLEMPAFIGLMSFMMGGPMLVLGAPAMSVLLMLARFPTETKLRAWMTRQAEKLAEALR